MANPYTTSSFLDIPVWPGSASFATGSTPFGYFDTDSDFQTDAPKIADYCAKKLGYPIQDVELIDTNFFACFEEAVMEYSSQVNQFNIRENLLTLRGTEISGSNWTHQDVNLNFDRIIVLSHAYGTEAGAGGLIDYKSGYIDTEAYVQDYDLQELWANVSESGNRIEIKKVFHDHSPLLSVGYGAPDYSQNTIGLDTQILMDTFGWGSLAIGGANFLLTPINYDLMRMQAIEFNNQMRRSSYSFEIINNKLKVFPVPKYAYRLYFRYIVCNDRKNPVVSPASGSIESGSIVSDYSNVPYDYMIYSNINDVGKQWIIKYTLASSKELLGVVRGKYGSAVTLPNGDLQLDGQNLRDEGAAMREKLTEQLRENLLESSRKMLLEKQKDEADFLQDAINKIPLKIYIA